jgi:thiazole synthase
VVIAVGGAEGRWRPTSHGGRQGLRLAPRWWHRQVQRFAETERRDRGERRAHRDGAIRRTNIGQNAGEPNLLGRPAALALHDPSQHRRLLHAQDAVRTLRLARELLDGHKLVKLEVLGDAESLYPNMPETLAAAKTLVAEGFEVMAYCNDDPIMAKQLEEMGCVAIMPLASLIGSGMGIINPWNLQIIIDRVQVPVIVDAGIGTASDAAIAMELGCDGVLMNTAIAKAKDPVRMANAMKLAVEAGREAFLAGRMAKKPYEASASSPQSGLIQKTG